MPLRLLGELDRSDTLAFAQGETGVWTRLLAPRLGAPLIFGYWCERPAAPGQPSIARLRRSDESRGRANAPVPAHLRVCKQ